MHHDIVGPQIGLEALYSSILKRPCCVAVEAVFPFGPGKVLGKISVPDIVLKLHGIRVHTGLSILTVSTRDIHSRPQIRAEADAERSPSGLLRVGDA